MTNIPGPRLLLSNRVGYEFSRPQAFNDRKRIFPENQGGTGRICSSLVFFLVLIPEWFYCGGAQCFLRRCIAGASGRQKYGPECAASEKLWTRKCNTTMESFPSPPNLYFVSTVVIFSSIIFGHIMFTKPDFYSRLNQ